MKQILLLLTVAFCLPVFSQPITVNTTTHTIPQLVNDVLINSTCVQANNITWSTGSNFGSVNGIGYFQSANPNFPMQAGVVLSTGSALSAVGPNTSMLNEGAQNWPGDTSLETTLAQAGIPMASVNATVLEFDFTPISPQFNFDFIFASEEYGNFQCQFSDAFAFLLTNMNTGVTTNLAVVPNTTTPISVVTIRDFLYNSSCGSSNSQYFGSFNGGSAAASSATNFNGQTVLLNASSTLTPNTPYHIKLVIADRTDYESDSAIFIASNSFNIGQQVLGLDLTTAAGTAICYGQSYELNTGLNPANYTFSWTRNGQPIAGQTGASITVTQPGTYAVTYANNDNLCQPTVDTVNIEYYPQLTTPNPTVLYKCDSGASSYSFNLALNTPIVTQGMPAGTTAAYFATADDANNNVSPLPINYSVSGDQTVYVRIQVPPTGCFVVKSFLLDITNGPTATVPQNVTVCENSSTPGVGTLVFSTVTPQVLNGQSPGLNIVTYHQTQANADAGTGAAGGSWAVTNGQTIYVRVRNSSDTTCYTTISFQVTVLPTPSVDQLQNVTVCENYVLPVLTNGNYFSGSNGTGTPMFAGNVITETQTIYIFNQPGGPGSCSAQTSFLVKIVDPETMTPSDGTYCGNFVVPSLEIGHYYTQAGGQGTQINTGTVLSQSQTLYFYFSSNVAPFCVIDTDVNITVVPNPHIPDYPNVFNCVSYTLPPLSFGAYFTGMGGTGTPLAPGSVITTSQTIYVYAQSGTTPNCIGQDGFRVQIGLDTPPDVSQCNGYVLPTLPMGNYYTGPGGTGTIIPAGTSIETSQTVYLYVPGGNDCDPDRHFNLDISQPQIDVVGNQSVCYTYTLPAITNGEYFTEPNGQGTNLHGGDEITTTQTIYIYKQLNSVCANQNSFTVTVNPGPAIDSRSEIDVCNAYVLTALGVGNYYTGPNGTGQQLAAGSVITQSQLIYIYAQSTAAPFCSAQNSFQINIFSIEADSPAPVTACDSYVLPALTVGNYYRNAGGPLFNGENDMFQAGDAITESITLHIYTESGERINCTDDNLFPITINHTPVPTNLPNQYACNSYTLLPLTVGDYYTGPGKTGTLLHAGDVITTTQTLYIYAETGTMPNCYAQNSFVATVFNVDELPSLTTCESFALPALNVGQYYTGPNGTGTHLNAGTSVSQSGTIYIYAQSPFSPTCSDESSFVLTIIDTPVANPVTIQQATTCDEDATNDGIFAFDLTTLSATALGTQTGPEFSATWFESFDNANNNTNAVTSSELTTVFVRVSNSLAPNCFAIRQVTLRVNKLPEPKPKSGIICFDSETQTLLSPYVIYSELSPATHTFQWLNDAGQVLGTGTSFTAVTPGEYSVIAMNNATGCVSMPATVTVQGSEPALISYTTNDNFSDNMVLTVTAQGTGDYEYQLDGGVWQDSNIFENVGSGIHTVTVRDKNGCGQDTSEALVVNYPHYFTPNADGIHDTWNIVDLDEQLQSKITIFDRYGKLITQIKPNGDGWDGTYNGKPMPSTDYWFSVNYTERGQEKEFRAHFSMKR